MRCKPYIEYIDRRARRTDYPPDRLPAHLRPWPQDPVVERRAARRITRRIAKFVTPAGYVAGEHGRLHGDQAFMDYTFIHFSGFSDAAKGRLVGGAVRALGIDPEQAAANRRALACDREVTAQAAADFGLAARHGDRGRLRDTAASALGAGIVRPGMLFDVAGTAAVLAGCTDRFVADVKNHALLTMRSVIPGLWNPLAYIAGGGLALRWFRDQFFNPLRGEPQALEMTSMR